MQLLHRLACEPPFRILVRSVLQYLPVSVQQRALWEISPRPHYLLGVLAAAKQALRERVGQISVIEFGVAGGNGLVALQSEAEAVEQATSVKIRVFGFDMGASGLPPFIGDYHDQPDAWQPGDFPMDEECLRARLAPRTTPILGNMRDTVSEFFGTYTTSTYRVRLCRRRPLLFEPRLASDLHRSWQHHAAARAGPL